MLVSSIKAIRTSVEGGLEGADLRPGSGCRVFFRPERLTGRWWARTQDVDSRALAILRSGAHLDHGGDVELLHQVLEADGGLRADGGILRPDELFKAAGPSIVGRLLLRLCWAVGGGGKCPHRRNSGCGVSAGAGFVHISSFADDQGGDRGGRSWLGLRFGLGGRS